MDQHSTDVLTVHVRRLRSALWAMALPGLLSLSAAASHPSASKKVTADLIVTNARVYTVNRQQPWAEAVAVKDDEIVAVGSSTQAAAYRGAHTTVVDAHKHLLLPGFTDSHIHFMEGSLQNTEVHLEGTKNLTEIQKAVQDYATAHPSLPWILGRGWDYSEFGTHTLPDRKDLDAVVAERPVLLVGYDGHTSWVNSKALELAGITQDTPNPPNGEIVRDPQTGEPTGALKEAAANLVLKIVPQPTSEERLEALRQGMKLANQAGLTSVISCGNDTAFMSDDDYFDLYDSLKRSRQLTVRFYISNYQAPGQFRPEDLQKIEDTRQRYAPQDDWLAGGAVKFYLDGVVESHTAAMLTPYADDSSKFGSLRWDPEKYKQAVTELDKRGIQVFTHAIGDYAVRLALDVYEEAASMNHTHDARHRIEHIETITAQDIPRFGSLGVIASMQPLHAYPDEDILNVWLRNAGLEREPRAFAWQSIAKAGGHLAFGSDWPVVTLNPWLGIQNAVTRQTREGKPAGGWEPEQRVSLAQAIEGYTLGATYSVRRDKRVGSIEPGKLADMILLSQNLFAIDPHKIGKTEVLWTMVGGKLVYTSAAWTQTTREKSAVSKKVH